MSPEQQALADNISRALEADPDIMAAWLSGSLGQGIEDDFSDVDVLVLAADGKVDEVARRWAADLSPIGEIVMARPLFGGRVITSVTADWDRFDLSFVDRDGLKRYAAEDLKPLFDKGTDARPGQLPIGDYAPSPAAVAAIVEEFIRVLGLLFTVGGREEYVNAFFGVGHLRRGLIDLMIEENRIAPWRRGGALHLNRLLTPEQLAELAALPPLQATRESVITANLELARLFLPRARRLMEEVGAPWPDAFEAATRRKIEKSIGVRF